MTEEEFRYFIRAKAREFWHNTDGTVSRQKRVFLTENEVFEFGTFIADAALESFSNQPKQINHVESLRIIINNLLDLVEVKNGKDITRDPNPESPRHNFEEHSGVEEEGVSSGITKSGN